jgi:DNA replication protein DnaC
MKYEDIRAKMEYLKLTNTAAFIAEIIEDSTLQKKSHLEFFNKILSTEIQAREESRIATSLKLSGLPRGLHLENFDYLFQPSVDKARIEILSTCEFIRNHENILMFGPPGTGKTHLAVGLGVRAIHMGYSVIYYTLEELLSQLKKRAPIPVCKQKARAYVKSSAMIIDELGYQVMDRNETHLFFQLISARYLKGSTIITSNRSVKEWVSVFAGDQMATTAILDRLFHKAHIFTIDGNSYRLKNYNKMMKEVENNEIA